MSTTVSATTAPSRRARDKLVDYKGTVKDMIAKVGHINVPLPLLPKTNDPIDGIAQQSALINMLKGEAEKEADAQRKRLREALEGKTPDKPGTYVIHQSEFVIVQCTAYYQERKPVLNADKVILLLAKQFNVPLDQAQAHVAACMDSGSTSDLVLQFKSTLLR